ncbi:MAG: ferric reductase-like transmembrane domain-containing protein [Acidobacteriaceae bacterium]
MTNFSTNEPTRWPASRRTKRLVRRLGTHHLSLAAATASTVFCLYITRPYRDVITKLSFSTAYPALVLLVITLWIGPWNLLRGHRTPVSSDLRRDIGIWAGILGIVHTIIGFCVHMRGRPWLYFIYPRSQHHSFPLRHDIFGFANETGLIATIILVVLFATSNDYSLRRLGTPRWKQLQRWNYALFLFVLLHTVAYQTIEKQHAPFVAAVVACSAMTLCLQALGFQRRRARQSIATGSGVEQEYEP